MTELILMSTNIVLVLVIQDFIAATKMTGPYTVNGFGDTGNCSFTEM